MTVNLPHGAIPLWRTAFTYTGLETLWYDTTALQYEYDVTAVTWYNTDIFATRTTLFGNIRVVSTKIGMLNGPYIYDSSGNSQP